jgi:anti-sigma B factor antagonist
MVSDPLVIDRIPRAAEGQDVLCLSGPLTAENLSPFQNAVRRDYASTMILDLTDVPYVDSAGLGSLIAAYVTHQKAGRRVVLSGVNPRVMKLFEITKTDSLFFIFPTLADAIDALTKAGTA